METQAITNQSEIGDDLLEYIKNEAQKLANQSEFEINNYMDSEVLNPAVRSYLGINYKDQNFAFELTDLSLSFKENRLLMSSDANLGGWFKNLKETVRKVLCKIVGALGADEEFDWKDIIKTILIALIPLLAGGVYAAVITPILIALIAKLIKYGYNSVCPL